MGKCVITMVNGIIQSYILYSLCIVIYSLYSSCIVI